MPLTTPAFFRISLRVTKPAFTPTTRNRKLNPVNGKVRGHLHRRTQGKWEATSSHCLFDQKVIAHKEFVPPDQTVNAAFYVEILKRLRENVRRKRPDQWRNNTWLLRHDNAPAHAVLLTRRFLTENNMTVVPHPPYSPGLAPGDFFLFLKLKWSLRGEDFRRWRKFKQSRRPSWTRYEKITSKNVSKTGIAAGIVVKPQKGTTLQGDAGP